VIGERDLVGRRGPPRNSASEGTARPSHNGCGVKTFARSWKMFCQSPLIWAAALSKSKQTDLARPMQEENRGRRQTTPRSSGVAVEWIRQLVMNDLRCHPSSTGFPRIGNQQSGASTTPHATFRTSIRGSVRGFFFTLGAQNSCWKSAATPDSNRPPDCHEKEGFDKYIRPLK